MEELIRQINDFAEQAGIIEPDAGRRRELLGEVNDYTERFLETLPDRPAFNFTEDMGAGLYDSPITEEGMDIGEILRIYKENVDDQALCAVSGKFFGYIAPCSMYYSALGDYMAAVMDEYAGEFSSSPGAVRMEYQLLDWMAELVGYHAGTAKGVLASGGSIATLTCIVTAREAHGLNAEEYPRAVVYHTRFTHHCVAKSLHIAGLGGCVMRAVPTDADFRMDPDALAEMIRNDRAAGLEPWLVVSSAGTTDLGNVDELDRIGALAREHELWFHVDAAYGGFFILCDLVRHRFRGIEMSDSVVMNPHKGLHTPFGLGAALIRDGEHLYRSHYYTADYLQDRAFHRQELSPADVSPELTRHFRALRLWLPLKLIGVAPFRAMLSEKLLLTRYAWQRLQSTPGFEVGPEPELSILVFRYIDVDGDVDEFNRKLVEALRRDGTIFLTSTLIDNVYMLRLSILSYRTHIDTIDLAIDVIRREVEKLKNP
ncbi:MAG: aminotransferase class V-fold PLP-dependent enzyme, partial [Gammaproteobacteria bacterium]|nr:aminotransferase class V-fold PLP-dependent enzyme [Gammaproteobacteria bacterium]